ncbi:putative alcohol dehydrogenase [Daldinia caldariorum]|uniref:putative alcohol dehydrogenase n=1 Tax=Daldinia caldariorum TaxID=326644 RepID=UPI0020089AF5|nr:putative alcohol dehydrogenase [Daldinia caldariorum]KAI1468151.1 putative alcohol dehydrogenase [Daldinia caldariorum]
MPVLTTPEQVLVRVLAVAPNPSDFKMVKYSPQATTKIAIGCDFCGIVEESRQEDKFPKGTRVAGAKFPYGTSTSGAFSDWLVADTRQLLRIPDAFDDLEGAAIGGICWGTCVVALFADAEGLCLPGSLTKPANKSYPVLVYGAVTATGTMACQMLKLAGHTPIAVTSAASASLACTYGAVGSALYTSRTCVEDIRSFIPKGAVIRHALDCIINTESAAACFAAIGRAGGRYACLESLQDEWRTRRAVYVKEVMGFEGFGFEVALGDSIYSRKANRELFLEGCFWTNEMQASLDAGLIKPHPSWGWLRKVTGRIGPKEDICIYLN